VPEGDTIFRAARTLHQALAGRTVLRFQSVFPRLTRVDVDRPVSGRVIEAVSARGKHVLMALSGDLVLRTHMRMHGSWHLYRPGERWQRPAHDMRIVLGTEAFEAVAFDVPDGEFIKRSELDQAAALKDLGPDPLSDHFDLTDAVARIATRAETAIADALLDQQAIAGIGNIFKSETLFAARVNPFVAVRQLPAERITMIVETATRLLRASADGRLRFSVYGRGGEPCRRCGTAIRREKQGPNARSTYLCEQCQPRISAPPAIEVR
jgi:endonuclease-8